MVSLSDLTRISRQINSFTTLSFINNIIYVAGKTRLYRIYYYSSVITSQRGSAWQCYIGRSHQNLVGIWWECWETNGKPAFFHLSASRNQWEFYNQFWHRWLRWWDLQTRQIWLRSVHRGRLHTVVKYHTFVTCSPFFLYMFIFRFLISPTGRNFQPIHTFNSRAVNRTRAFWGGGWSL